MEFLDHGADVHEGQAGVEDVVHHEHIAVADVEFQGFGDDQFSRGTRFAVVAGYADIIEPELHG